MLGIIDELDDGGQEKSSKTLAIDSFLNTKDIHDNPWRSVAKTVAEGDPQSTDYIFSEWTHERIAYEYLQKMKEVFDARERAED